MENEICVIRQVFLGDRATQRFFSKFPPVIRVALNHAAIDVYDDQQSRWET
jgi:hypothetical protein